MTLYEWKKYKEKINLIVIRCYHHFLYNDVASLIQEIDQYYRFNAYINYYNNKHPFKSFRSKIKLSYDKQWLDIKIKSKIAELEELIILMKLGS